MTPEQLLDAGLTLNEAKVYLALLNLGSAAVPDIVRESKVHRVNCYDIIKRLMTKGLISAVIKSNKKYYQPAPPDELLRQIEYKKQSVAELLPDLNSIFSSRKSKQEVYYFRGPDGILAAYYMMLDQGATLYGLGGKGINRKILKHRHEKFERERIKRGIHIKALYYESTRKEISQSKEEMWELRYIADEFDSPSMVDICGDLVLILLPNLEKNDILGIVIENKDIAESYRNHFNFMWKHASD